MHITSISLKDIIYNKPQSSINIPKIDDHIQYGLGFFETILVLDKGVFINEHVTRLNHSLSTFNINRSISKETISEFITINSIKHLGLKIIITENLVIATTRPLHYNEDYYKKGADISLSPIVRSSKSYLINHKSTNYGDMILSLRKAHNIGLDDYIFINELGHVVESCIANVFIIKDNKLITPPTEDGLLPGIIRQFIIEHFDVSIRSITLDDLKHCDSAFLTNSLVGLIHISKFMDTTYNKHQLITTISDYYTSYIREDD